MRWWTLRRLRRTLSDDSDSYTSSIARLEAARELRKVRGPRAIDLLVMALKDKSWEVRAEAAEALTGLGWQPSGSEENASYAVAQRRFDEAATIGGSAVEPLLIAIMDTHQPPEYCKEAASALGKSGNAPVDRLMLLHQQPRERSENPGRCSSCTRLC